MTEQTRKFVDSQTGTIYNVPEWIVKNFEKNNGFQEGTLPKTMAMEGITSTGKAYKFKFDNDLMMFAPLSRTVVDESNESIVDFIDVNK